MASPEDADQPRKTWSRNPEGKYYGGGWPGPRKQNVTVGLDPEGTDKGSLASVNARAKAAGVSRGEILRQLVAYADEHMPPSRPS
jgi:hypothetical protein